MTVPGGGIGVVVVAVTLGVVEDFGGVEEVLFAEGVVVLRATLDVV